MSPRVTVVDYGLGNLRSVVRAFEYCGASVDWATRPEHVAGAARLVVPGVGAFTDGMAQLEARGLVESLRAFARSDRPLLGICLGMQLLFDVGEEFGEHAGLGVFPGRVVSLPPRRTDGLPHKIPNIGWCELRLSATHQDWTGSILEELPPGASVYFAHSFHGHPAEPDQVLATIDFGGWPVPAVMRSGRVTGCQFHPEKSGPVGLRIIRNFLES